MSEYALEMSGVTKAFSKVTALDNVDFKVKKGEVHALIGENGAGKSTLMKVLSGVYKQDAGSIKLNGETVEVKNPKDAIDKGVAIIYQELSLVPDLNAIQNIVLGQEKKKGAFIDKKAENDFAVKYLDYVSKGNIGDYRRPVKYLSVAQQQMVDIAKALSYKTQIIIMDEPTDSLTNTEIESLFEIVRQLKKDGITVIYISHRLEELFEVCDRVTVLRDGKNVTDANISDIDKDWLIGKMIGRDLSNTFPPRHRIESDEVVLEVDKLTGEKYKDVSFKLHKGEILGFGGLVGAGRTEVLRGVFGADKTLSGTIRINGQEAKISHPNDAIGKEIGFATEDRKTQGLFLTQDICDNIVAASLNRVSKKGFVNRKEEKALAEKYFNDLKVVAPDINKICQYLSGGNQQKVVLAKWLASECKILFLDEPTRGIDVGAKYEIYLLMDKLVQEGVSIIMISSEMPELMGVSDRILVMHEGDLVGELSRDEFSEHNIMKLASGNS